MLYDVHEKRIDMTKLSSVFFLVLGFVISVYFYLYNPESSDAFFLTCPTKYFFQLDCPLCGGQRYVHYLLNGNIKAAFQANALLFFIFPPLFYNGLVTLLKPFSVKLPVIPVSNKMIIVGVVVAILFTLIRNDMVPF